MLFWPALLHGAATPGAMTRRLGANPRPLAHARGSVQSRDRKGSASWACAGGRLRPTKGYENGLDQVWS
jgi:hypothetical protein